MAKAEWQTKRTRSYRRIYLVANGKTALNKAKWEKDNYFFRSQLVANARQPRTTKSTQKNK